MTPGPPLRGTLSPPDTSSTKICRSARPAGERRGEVVAAALHQHQVKRPEALLQVLHRVQVRRDVIADRGVRAAAGPHRDDPVQVEHARPAQEVRVLGRVDVVGDHGEGDVVPQRPAQRRDQRRLARADGPADADPQRPPRPRRCRVLVDAMVVRAVAPSRAPWSRAPWSRTPWSRTPWSWVLSCALSGLKEPHLRSDMRFRQQVKGRRGRAGQVDRAAPRRSPAPRAATWSIPRASPASTPVARIGSRASSRTAALAGPATAW